MYVVIYVCVCVCRYFLSFSRVQVRTFGPKTSQAACNGEVEHDEAHANDASPTANEGAPDIGAGDVDSDEDYDAGALFLDSSTSSEDAPGTGAGNVSSEDGSGAGNASSDDEDHDDIASTASEDAPGIGAGDTSSGDSSRGTTWLYLDPPPPQPPPLMQTVSRSRSSSSSSSSLKSVRTLKVARMLRASSNIN